MVRNFAHSIMVLIFAVLTMSGIHDMIFMTAYRQGFWNYAEFLFFFTLIVVVGWTVWKKKRNTRPKDIFDAVLYACAIPSPQIGLIVWVWNKPFWVVQLIVLAFFVYVGVTWKPLYWWKAQYRMFLRAPIHIQQSSKNR